MLISNSSKLPPSAYELANFLQYPKLLEYIRCFLYHQFHPESEDFGMDVPLDQGPRILNSLRIKVFHSAASMYFAPSDLSGIGGMHCECICAMPTSKKGPGCYDCVLINKDPEAASFHGLHAAQVQLFFPLILMVNNIHVHWCAGLLHMTMLHVKILGFGMYSQTKMVVYYVLHPWCTLTQSYVVLTSLVWQAIIFFLENFLMLILSMPFVFFTLANTLITMLTR
jgi:hypothetical protein